MREKFAITAATAMIGTACFGPYSYTSTGISMIDDPVPTMPEMVPAIRPTMRMKRKANGGLRKAGDGSRGVFMSEGATKERVGGCPLAPVSGPPYTALSVAAQSRDPAARI